MKVGDMASPGATPFSRAQTINLGDGGNMQNSSQVMPYSPARNPVDQNKPKVNPDATNLMANYYEGAINQRCKLPPYLDGTTIYSDQIQSLNGRMKVLDSITAVISILIIALIYYENETAWKNGFISTKLCSALRAMILVLAFIVIICVIIHYNYKIHVIKFRDNRMDEDVSLISTGLWWKLLIEILVNAIINPPGVDLIFTMEQLGMELTYSLDTLVAVVSLFRLYTVIRLFEHFSHWTNERSKRVCKVNGAQANAFFALKAYLSLKPYVILSAGLVLSTFILGIALRVFEIGMEDSSFEYIWNSFWVVILTMTTIGYGDIFPKTNLGRITCIVACIWGVFILSLFVVALTNTTEFTQKEEQVYDAIIMERAIRKKLKKDAGNLIKDFVILTFLRKRQYDHKRRTRLLMGILAKSDRFKTKRLNVYQKEEDNDELLTAMQYKIDDSLRELKFGLEQMKKLYDNAKKTQDEQKEFEIHIKKSHKLSVCLCNLASLLTEFGPIKPIKSMKEIESKSVLSAEELKEKVFRDGTTGNKLTNNNNDTGGFATGRARGGNLSIKEEDEYDDEEDEEEEDDEESQESPRYDQMSLSKTSSPYTRN